MDMGKGTSMGLGKATGIDTTDEGRCIVTRCGDQDSFGSTELDMLPGTIGSGGFSRALDDIFGAGSVPV